MSSNLLDAVTPPSSSQDSTAAPRRTEHVAVAAVFFANGAGFASWVSRIPAVRDALALSEAQLGMALFAMGVGAVLAFQLAGRGISLLGSRTLTLATGAIYCFVLPQPALMQSLPMLGFALLLFGAANGAMDVAMNALAVEVQGRQRRHIMSGLHGLWSAGGLCGAAFGGLMAQQGVSATVHLAGVAIALAVLLLVARRWLPRTPPVPAEPAHFERPEPGMLALGAIVFCSFLIEGAMADWSAVYLKDTLGKSAGEAALGYAAFATAMMLLRLAGDRLLLHWRGSSLLRWGNALSAVLLVAALLVRETPLVMAAFVMVGLGVAVVAPLVFSAAAKRSRRGPGHGIAAMATLGYTGFLIGPPVIGWLAHWSSLGTALMLLALLAAGISVFARQVDGPQAQGPGSN